MTVHRVRLFHSADGAEDYHTWLGQWITNMQPWEDPEVTNELPTIREPIDGGEDYYQTELAFEWGENRAIILDNLDEHATIHCEWHRIGYHECTHDETDPTPCSWDERRQDGPVTSNIPSVQ